MFDKVFYFKIGSKNVKVSMPKDSLSRFFVGIMSAMLVYDLFTGNMLGIILMSLFIALNVVSMR